MTKKLMKVKIKLLIMMMLYIHNTTPKFTKSTAETFAARLKQANLASKINIANCINKTDFYNKLKNVT